jgi:mono/diheme cytochrome c family protein
MPRSLGWSAPLALLAVSSISAMVCACRGSVSDVAPAPKPPLASTEAPRAKIVAVSGDLREGSALVLGRLDGRTLAFVADEDEDAVHTLDLEMGVELARTPVSGRPTQLLLVDGALAVARRDMASVVLLGADAATSPLRPVRTFATADEPIALAVDGDRSTLWVASGWGRRLEGFTLATGEPKASIALGREPRALLVADDGAHAYVGYASESKIDVVDLVAARVDEVSLDVAPESKTIGGGNCGGFGGAKKMMPFKPCMQHFSIPERFGRQTYALTRVTNAQSDAETILAPYVLVTPGEPQVVSSGYGGSSGPKSPSHVAFDVASLSTKSNGAVAMTREKTFRRSDDCTLPRGAVYDASSDLLFVACMGSDRIAAFHRDGASEAALTISVPGGPYALAIDPDKHVLVVATMFERDVTPLELLTFPATPEADSWMPPHHVVSLSHAPGQGLEADAAEGRKLFHRATDASISSDGRACASCHPDGRDDGLVWPTPKGPRQTIFLAGRLGRGAPFGWDAEHASMVEHMKITLKNLGGSGLDDGELSKVAAWLKVMPGPPRSAHALDAIEEHGHALFTSGKTGCSSCHMGGEFTDDAAHDVLSKTPADSAPTFLAPSLKFIGGSAPYFHDGRYSSLVDLLQGCDGKMGETKDLSAEDVAALEAYLRTL